MTQQSEAPAPTDRPARETVLAVDDNDMVRTYLWTILANEGYQVLEANSVAGALRACAAHVGPVHLLITDATVSPRGGPELAQQLRKRYPGLKVLYISGYSSSELEEHGLGPFGRDFLKKPFRPDELTRKVREVLDEPGEVKASGGQNSLPAPGR
jgi:DNA-binding NtrC family response regulator